MSLPRKPGPSPERTLGRFDGALLAGLLICSALVTVFLLVGRAYWLAPQAATPAATPATQILTITPLPTAIVAIAGTSEPTATPPVATNTPEIVPTPRVEPLDLAGLFAGMRFTVYGQGVPGQTIALYDNDLLVGTRVIDGNGNWEITIAQGLPAGEHRLVAVAIGLDGGRSEIVPVGFTILRAELPATSVAGISPTALEFVTPTEIMASTETATSTATPTLAPTVMPSLPPTKRPTEAPTVAALAVTEVAAMPTAMMPTALLPTVAPSSTLVPSATPEVMTEAPASSTPLIPTEALFTSNPPTEAQPTAAPTLALTALGLLPTEAQPSALPTITALPVAATPSSEPEATATPSPTPILSATPFPPPTQDGQGGGMGVMPQPSPAALSAVPTASSSANSSVAVPDQAGFSGWGEPGGSVTLLAEDGQVLATVPIGADGRWTASADADTLAAAGQITAQLYDPAGIIVSQMALREGEAARTPLLARTGASTAGRTHANGPALVLLLGLALLLGGVLFHQAGRVLHLMEPESGPQPTRPAQHVPAQRRGNLRRANQKGTPSRRP